MSDNLLSCSRRRALCLSAETATRLHQMQGQQSKYSPTQFTPTKREMPESAREGTTKTAATKRKVGRPALGWKAIIRQHAVQSGSSAFCKSSHAFATSTVEYRGLRVCAPVQGGSMPAVMACSQERWAHDMAGSHCIGKAGNEAARTLVALASDVSHHQRPDPYSRYAFIVHILLCIVKLSV